MNKSRMSKKEKKRMDKILTSIDPRECRILCLYYGIHTGLAPMNEEEIACNLYGEADPTVVANIGILLENGLRDIRREMVKEEEKCDDNHDAGLTFSDYF